MSNDQKIAIVLRAVRQSNFNPHQGYVPVCPYGERGRQEFLKEAQSLLANAGAIYLKPDNSGRAEGLIHVERQGSGFLLSATTAATQRFLGVALAQCGRKSAAYLNAPIVFIRSTEQLTKLVEVLTSESIREQVSCLGEGATGWIAETDLQAIKLADRPLEMHFIYAWNSETDQVSYLAGYAKVGASRIACNISHGGVALEIKRAQALLQSTCRQQGLTLAPDMFDYPALGDKVVKPFLRRIKNGVFCVSPADICHE